MACADRRPWLPFAKAYWVVKGPLKLGYSPTKLVSGEPVGWSAYFTLGPLELRIHFEW